MLFYFCYLTEDPHDVTITLPSPLIDNKVSTVTCTVSASPISDVTLYIVREGHADVEATKPESPIETPLSKSADVIFSKTDNGKKIKCVARWSYDSKDYSSLQQTMDVHCKYILRYFYVMRAKITLVYNKPWTYTVSIVYYSSIMIAKITLVYNKQSTYTVSIL